MYLPKHFTQNDFGKIKKIIEQNSFVTIFSFPHDEAPFVSHLPVIFSSEPEESKVLIGHFSRSNPHWKYFETNNKCLIVVNGPNAYISPRWYRVNRDVPTWNYIAVHLYGKIELMEKYEKQIEILKQLTSVFEGTEKNSWFFDLPSDLRDKEVLENSIISFKFYIEKFEAKFKLSQNRSAKDREGIIEGLSKERTDDMSKAIQELMNENE